MRVSSCASSVSFAPNTDEKLCTAAGKIYTVICAEYDGKARTTDGVNALLGEDNIRRGGELFEKYARGVQKKLGKKIDGLISGGHPAEKETELYNKIEKILTNISDGEK